MWWHRHLDLIFAAIGAGLGALAGWLEAWRYLRPLLRRFPNHVVRHIARLSIVFLQEASVLVAVFPLLEKYVQGGWSNVSSRLIVGTFVLSGSLFSAAILLGEDDQRA